MTKHEIIIEGYSHTHAKSIAEHLFEGVPEEVVRSQREELLTLGPDEVFSVCALSGSQVVGVCTGVRMKWFGSRHRVEMVQVVVGENHRGRGIAHQMMRKIAEHFSAGGIEIIQISTESGNEVAIKAYQKIGFIQIGLLKNGLKHDSEYSDEVMMAAPIESFLI
ncbi:GNAT family N-acetyltransferase [Candidatus Thorarchaeota archaeon]|nr:MAG: GNAT family N-acetyltransferase [Candidatus Thorarchaeota archaeon]